MSSSGKGCYMLSVLIVEDDYFIAGDHRAVFEDIGWRVIGPAPSVREALNLLSADTPTMAVLDMQLGPEMVTPVAVELQTRKIPFVVASGLSDLVAAGGEVFREVPNLGKSLDPDSIKRQVGKFREGKT